MATRAEIRTLRNTAIASDPNISQIVNPHAFANPAPRADSKAPRKLHTYASLDHHIRADTGAEEPKTPAAMRRAGDTRGDKQSLDQQPRRFDGRRAASIKGFGRIGVEPDHRALQSIVSRQGLKKQLPREDEIKRTGGLSAPTLVLAMTWEVHSRSETNAIRFVLSAPTFTDDEKLCSITTYPAMTFVRILASLCVCFRRWKLFRKSPLI